MIFNSKSLSQLELDKQVLLSEIRPIVHSDNYLLQAILQDYKALDSSSNKFEKIHCTLVASILLQKRIYFALSRDSLRDLMLADKNYPLELQGVSFSNTSYSSILAKMYNQFKLFQLVAQGDRTHASIFKVTHAEILSYLRTEVNEAEQLEQSLHFNKSKFKK